MNYEDLKWINQSLYSYKDKYYESHGYLDISISINTSDDINFSQPKIVFNLDNQGQRRNVRLSISDVIDLLDSFKDAMKLGQQLFNNKDRGGITKKYNNKDLIFEFTMINNDIHVVLIQIINNTSDSGSIIIPLKPQFVMIGKVLKMFERDYINITSTLPNRYLTSLALKTQIDTNRLLQILPTHFTNIQPEQYPDRREKIEETIQPLSYVGTKCSLCGEEQYNSPSGLTCKNGHGGADSMDEEPPMDSEFDQFAAENEDKVRIPELESEVLEPKEPISQEFNSPFIEHTLKNNIHNLEESMFALTTNNNPLITIMNQIYNGEGYTLLPGIKEQDLKSVFYISNLYYKMNFQSYIQNQTVLPLAVPVVKYDVDINEVDEKTIELSYDLFMISAYLKFYRNRMESFNSDPYTNGALVHFSFRCFLDVATYSYLKGKNQESYKNCILSRFKYFRETGFFEYYDKNLIENNQKPIYDNEIAEFVDKVFENVVDQDDIDKRHFLAHDTGSVKLPPKNNFSAEQITNEIVKYEIKTLFGQRIEDLTNNEEIIITFNKKLKKKYKQTDHRPKPRKKESHVLRYVKLKANEIPESYRQKFIDYLENMESSGYDYFNDQFKLEELADVVIKSVYIWNEYLEDKMKYTDFVLLVEECIDKDLIISKVKSDQGEKTEDWTSEIEM